MIQYSVIFLFMVFSLFAEGQVLQAQDSTYLQRFHAELKTTPFQKSKVDSIYIAAATRLAIVDTETKVIQQSDISEEEINSKVSLANQQKKDIREVRDLEIALLLSPEQRIVYEEKIKIKKPSVLHFGMNHDRANCNVCK
jgi:Mg2+ and Co2+ transporter CorA